jgi:hypothetical protein
MAVMVVAMGMNLRGRHEISSIRAEADGCQSGRRKTEEARSQKPEARSQKQEDVVSSQ